MSDVQGVPVERREPPQIDYANSIRADVAVLLADPLWRELPEAEQEACPHKVRLTIFSGPDFRSPHISRGAVAPNRKDGERLASSLRDACDLLGIPVHDHAPGEPLLPPRGEGAEWPMLDA